MKKIIITFILFSLLLSANAYEPELVGIIKTGSNENEIGYDAIGLPGDGPLTAKLFKISYDNKVYIFDKNHIAIKVFTNNLEFIRAISVKKHNIFSIRYLEIDNNDNIYTVNSSYGIKKLNENGELIYEINKYNLPQSVKGCGDFHPYKNCVFFYDRKHGINYIDEIGTIHKEEETKNFIERIKSDSLYRSKNDRFSSILNDFKDKDKLIIIEGKILSTQGYFLVNEVFKHLREKMAVNNKNKNQEEVPDISYVYIGRDNDNNTYWESYNNNNIYIFSEFGELLDSFEELNKNHKAVSPGGDLWYWDVQPDGVSFYKITRRW